MSLKFLLALIWLGGPPPAEAQLSSTGVSLAATTPDAVVASDGSGQYTSLQDAISKAPMRTGRGDPRWVIFVKRGTYRERVYVQRERGNMLIQGEDAATTVITYDLHAELPGPDGKPIGTFRTPTVQVDGDDMVWEDITIANGAGEPGPRAVGPPVAQAVALRVDGDRVVFRRCRFLGFQDTILLNRGRHYFADSYIEGTVDFIFGAATAFFDRTHIHVLRDGYITAASTPEGTANGFVFRDSRITGSPGMKTYLGRPWRIYAKTIFLRTDMSAVVRPEGWQNWSKPEAEKTAFYAEFGSKGDGASPRTRVPWARSLTAQDAALLTPERVLGGADGWKPGDPARERVVAATPTSMPWGAAVLRQKPEWYATPQALAIAESVLQYQSAEGAWPKNTDLAKPPASPEAAAEIQRGGEANTIDNGATTTPMRFLALVIGAKDDPRYRAAFDRGLEYLFASQYPNGGWPQFFPLREGYYSHITYNDDAMVNVMSLLRDVGEGRAPVAFVDQDRRDRANGAVARGVEVILKTQIRRDGKLIGWCAQHDEKTFEPAWARKFEPPSLSGNESVGITRFLMEIKDPAPKVVDSIEGAVAWLQASALTGLRVEEFTDALGRKDQRVVSDPNAPRLWARFYDIPTDRPIFLGRDSVVRHSVSEIEHERRNGYAYYGVWPESLLSRDYPRWQKKHVAGGVRVP